MATLGGCVRSSESPAELLDLLLKRFNAALVDRRNRFVFGALDPPSIKPSQHPFTPPAKARRTSTLAGPGRIPKFVFSTRQQGRVAELPQRGRMGCRGHKAAITSLFRLWREPVTGSSRHLHRLNDGLGSR